MTDLLTGLGLVLVIEGIAYALAPDAMRRLAAMAAALPPSRLRFSGLAGAVVGLGVVWLARG